MMEDLHRDQEQCVPVGSMTSGVQTTTKNIPTRVIYHRSSPSLCGPVCSFHPHPGSVNVMGLYRVFYLALSFGL